VRRNEHIAFNIESKTDTPHRPVYAFDIVDHVASVTLQQTVSLSVYYMKIE